LEEICSYDLEITQITPREGWVEQNPVEILEAVRLCATEACVKLVALGKLLQSALTMYNPKQLYITGYSVKDIVTIGVTNQRESTVVWDKLTGEPLYNAISR
jgi:glycerol kinase